MTRDDARATLLRALEQLEEAESDLSDADQIMLCVVYSAGSTDEDGCWHEIGGWVNTSGPLWVHAAMLERAAKRLEDGYDDPDDEE